MKKNLLTILGAGVLAGCMTVPQGEDRGPITKTFNAPRDKVWPIVVSEVGLKYPVKAIDGASGLITTDWLKADDIKAIADLPRSEPAFIPAIGRASLNLLVTGKDETTVAISVHVERWYEGMKSYQTCTSKGIIESNLFSMIEAKLK